MESESRNMGRAVKTENLKSEIGVGTDRSI
jgi:hypothetical protein